MCRFVEQALTRSKALPTSKGAVVLVQLFSSARDLGDDNGPVDEWASAPCGSLKLFAFAETI